MSKEFDFSCCGKEMVCLGLVDVMAPEVESIRRWVCPVCGHGVDLVQFNLDEPELHNELELYGEAASPPHIQQLKGGDLKMADENYDNTETATLVPTKAGKGYKVVHNGLWFYTSKAALLDMVQGKAKACTFHTIKDEQVAVQ